MELLKIKKLSKNYLTKKQIVCALKEINLSINDNEFIALVGPSGCGKSTILSIIGNLESKSSGQINFNKENLFDQSFYFLNFLLLKELSIYHNRKVQLVL